MVAELSGSNVGKSLAGSRSWITQATPVLEFQTYRGPVLTFTGSLAFPSVPWILLLL